MSTEAESQKAIELDHCYSRRSKARSSRRGCKSDANCEADFSNLAHQSNKLNCESEDSNDIDSDSEDELCQKNNETLPNFFAKSDCCFAICKAPLPKALFHSLDSQINDLSTVFESKNFYFWDWNHFCHGHNFVHYHKTTEIVLSNIIQFIKNVNLFGEFDDDDQKALIVGGWQDLTLAIDLLNTSDNGNYYEAPDANNNRIMVPVDIMKNDGLFDEYNKYKSLVSSFSAEYRKDVTLMAIVCGILLFIPERTGSRNKALIWKYQDMFYNFLRAYLISKSKSQTSVQMSFLTLIELMSRLRGISCLMGDVLKKIDKTELKVTCPLIHEIIYKAQLN